MLQLLHFVHFADIFFHDIGLGGALAPPLATPVSNMDCSI